MEFSDHMRCAEGEFRAKKFRAAADACRNALTVADFARPADYGYAFDLLCQSFLVRNDEAACVAEARTACEQDLAAHGPQFWNQLHFGSLAMLNDDPEQANVYYAAARALPFGGTHRAVGAYSARPPSWLNALDDAPVASSRQPSFEIEQLDVPAGQQPFFLVSCNGTYFSQWAEIYLSSLGQAHPAFCVHFHLLDPSPEDFAYIRSLRTQISSDATLNCTFEKNLPMTIQAGLETLKAYYATARYIHLPELMMLYGRDAIISDIDMNFHSDPCVLGERLGHASIGFRFSGMFKFFPWTSITANFCYAKFTPDVVAFFRQVSSYAMAQFSTANKNDRLWYIDQNAMTTAFMMKSGQGQQAFFIDLNSVGTSRIFSFAQADKASFKNLAMANMTPQTSP